MLWVSAGPKFFSQVLVAPFLAIDFGFNDKSQRVGTMSGSELSRKSAAELADLIRSRKISPVELLDSCLATIDRLNPVFNAVVTLAAEEALACAKRAEKQVLNEDGLGPLHGIPILIKDVTETAGIRTTYASPLFTDNIPNNDAEVVARLRRAGAIILGKTNTPEFAAGANTVNRVFGATLNPWNTKLSPAGSSGGSAVAVASGMVPVAHGTDFGASLRMPAAFCGIVGLRTTPGLIPNHPMPLPWDQGQVHGPLARTAIDAALMLDGMTGLDRMWPISVAPTWKSARDAVAESDGVKGLKVAYAPDIAGIGVEEEIAAACRAAALGLSKDGADVEEIDFDLSDGRDAYLTMRAEWMVGQQFHYLDKLDQLDKNLAGNVRGGLELSLVDTARAQHIRQDILNRYRKLFDKYDILLTPISPVAPFPIEQNYPSEIGGRKLNSYADWMAPAFLVTMVGLVGGSVPVSLSKAGLPIGMQLVGPRLSEVSVLSLAKHVQLTNPIGWPTVVSELEAGDTG